MSVLFWRRTDVPGLERLELTVLAEAITASSTVICAEDGGFRLDHRKHGAGHRAPLEVQSV